MSWKVPLFEIYWDEDDVDAVTSVIRSGKYWATGSQIVEFEKKLAEFNQMDYAVVFNSGTSGMDANFKAYGIGRGDEVIVPSLSFISTANVVLLQNAKPVFADIDHHTMSIDPEKVLDLINHKTKAIFPMYYGGHFCNIEELRDISEDKGVLLIEDNAESLGADLNGKLAGTYGDSSILSFCQNKIITTGEGGAVLTNSKEHCKKLQTIRSHGRSIKNTNYFNSSISPDYNEIGYNLRMPTMNAALGISQLNKINYMIKKRREVAEHYNSSLSKIRQINLIKSYKKSNSVYQLYSIIIDTHENRENLRRYLEKNKIMSKIYFDPIHKSGLYQSLRDYKDLSLPITEDISSRILSLPIHPSLKYEKREIVIETIKDFFN